MLIFPFLDTTYETNLSENLIKMQISCKYFFPFLIVVYKISATLFRPVLLAYEPTFIPGHWDELIYKSLLLNDVVCDSC